MAIVFGLAAVAQARGLAARAVIQGLLQSGFQLGVDWVSMWCSSSIAALPVGRSERVLYPHFITKPLKQNDAGSRALIDSRAVICYKAYATTGGAENGG